MAAKRNPGALAGATGAGTPIHATADGTRNIARKSRGGTPYRITSGNGDPFRIVVTGRDRWALEQLRKAGAQGCTPFKNPAPRWSAYVFNLRELGVRIETITELHGGEFSGHHARYVLRSGVSPDWKGGAE
ncbi:winged helix domain-containing protein [Sedimentitalea nanhaiensis]|uniref:Winged helix domain-containing protein n=1 Tax=Sedimentitalea nanhaiensis TaxID=999627 RepID=A0A1I7CKZ9_9RHOB|nr:hypothetical protein [Sedimentitalea nanhaiensis]SFU00064.1 hypothetical protein SAMN05216236_11778 [Sedimentitalea nanhaiensis]